MARVSLAIVGTLKAGRMAQHVRVDRHAKFGGVAGAGNQLPEGGRGHRRAALGNKDVGTVWISTQHLAQGPEFRPTQRMRTGQPVLAAAHMRQAMPQINLLAPQSDKRPYPAL